MTALEDSIVAGGFVAKAGALLKIAKVLEGRPLEEACATMAAVSASLGFYEEARRFLSLAESYRAEAEAPK